MIGDQFSEPTANRAQPAKAARDDDDRAPDAAEAPSPGGATAPAHEQDAAGIDSVALLMNQLRALSHHFARYLAAKSDGFHLSVRDGVVRIVLSAAVFIAICGGVIAASCFLLSGIAGGIGELCGQRLWIGDGAAGLLALAVLGLGVRYAIARQNKTHREVTVRKYEARAKEW